MNINDRYNEISEKLRKIRENLLLELNDIEMKKIKSNDICDYCSGTGCNMRECKGLRFVGFELYKII